jgi:ubiquitin-like-conjugating enzyme ATG3
MASYFRQAREWATPTLKSSAFIDRGVLTPEEFVRAGDELVYRCPTWQWESSCASKPPKSHLPVDKQYLITRNVPCPNRCDALEGEFYSFSKEPVGGGGGAAQEGGGGLENEDDWLVSSKVVVGENNNGENDNGNTNNNNMGIEDEFDILDEDGEVVVAPTKETTKEAPPKAEEEEEDEYADMMDDDDAMVDDNILQDDDTALAASNDTNTNDTNNNVLKVRTYDLSITYDKYYQTPRIFLIGRNTDDQPLTAKEMMQDVMSDYANKTVTMESHPHVSGPHASIHPCQHGKVMKAIVRNLMKSDGSGDGKPQPQPPTVEMYLFIFLKFVSSMIPTINYDFTMDVQADTRN